MTTGVKIVLGVVGAVVVVGIVAVAGLAYIGHRMVKNAMAQGAAFGAAMPDSPLATAMRSGGRNGSHGDECKYLSAADVSAAIGVPVVNTTSDGNGCHYFVHGSANSLHAKHIALPMKNNPQMYKIMLGNQPNAAEDLASPETTAAVNVEVWDHGGASQFALISHGVAFRKPGAAPPPGLSGVGDDAFTIGNNALIAHKGDKYINIDYANCPCGTEQMAILARKLSDQL